MLSRFYSPLRSLRCVPVRNALVFRHYSAETKEAEQKTDAKEAAQPAIEEKLAEKDKQIAQLQVTFKRYLK
jgi:hypothetical protein